MRVLLEVAYKRLQRTDLRTVLRRLLPKPLYVLAPRLCEG
jgi:hypothetical protein